MQCFSASFSNIELYLLQDTSYHQVRGFPAYLVSEGAAKLGRDWIYASKALTARRSNSVASPEIHSERQGKDRHLFNIACI